ncbi:MAG TPA: membrane protease subunit, stomatin/prohibitin [Cyanobacteria bacterium UBA8553]|nr:membrane protease subunit, stomatin/prohibitin [Cyanobacteria bacterium UBA8553]HAJ61368.1 membrane protease subunit, stomatin/prohibitin [Cyanobacteria bacterium UBA8543]
MTSINRLPRTNYITIGGITLTLFIGITFLKSFLVTVNPGERGVVVQLGKVQNNVLDEGTYPVLPFITSVKKLNVRIQKTDIEASAGTKDLQNISTKLTLNWYIEPSKVNKVYQEIGDVNDVVSRIITPALNEVLKAATPKRTAEEILTERAQLKEDIDREIKKRLTAYGIHVNEVALVNVAFSPEFAKAIEAKQIAEQQAKQAEYEALKATKEAQAEVNRAKGQAEAQRLMRQTLTPELLQKQAIEKWNGQFPQVMSSNGTLPFINVSPKNLPAK